YSAADGFFHRRRRRHRTDWSELDGLWCMSAPPNEYSRACSSAAESASLESRTTTTHVVPIPFPRTDQRPRGSPLRQIHPDAKALRRLPLRARGRRAVHGATPRLRHRALESEHQAIVKQTRMINAARIADERVGDATQVEQTIPVGVVACEARDFQSQHETAVTQGHLRRHTSEARTIGKTGAGHAQIFVNHFNLIARPAELDRAVCQSMLTCRRFTIVFHLRGAGLAHVDDGVTAQMIGRNLTHFIHRGSPRWQSQGFWRLTGRVCLPGRRAAPRPGCSTRGRRFPAVVRRESLAAALSWTISCGAGDCEELAVSSRRSRASTTVRAWSNCVQEASNAV